MASNTKAQRRRAELERQALHNSYVQRLCSYFDNSVELLNAPIIDFKNGVKLEAPKRYILQLLRENGAVAYDRKTDMILRFSEVGIDVYGLPARYRLFGFNGTTYERPAEDICILRANDVKYGIQDYIELQAHKLVDIDMAMHQNLDAIKTASIVPVESEQAALTLMNAAEARRIGASVIYVSKQSGITPNTLNTQPTGAVYLGDKLQELRTQIIRETYSNLGFAVSNEDKKERVQSAELTTLNTHGLDAINILVDTFNYDAEYYGLDIRLKANTELAKQKEEAQKMQAKTQVNNEKENNNGDRL